MTDDWSFAEDPAPRPFPWPPPHDGPVLGAFGETWKTATFDPAAFFRRTPRAGGTGPALLYYMVVGILVAGASLFWEALAGGGLGDEAVAAELGIGAVSPIVMFLLSPIILLFTLGIAASVVHVLLLLFGGASHGFGTSVRVFCYAYSPMLFGVIPLLGTLIGMVWMVVIAIIGLREAHETETWKPSVAVLVPFLVMAGLLFVAFLTLMVTAAAIAT